MTLTRLSVCVFLSGAAGLVYEVVWGRALGLVFGTTLHAVSTVLTVFMAGLALGSYIVGRVLGNGKCQPLTLYGGLEVGIGAWAAATPWLFRAVGWAQAQAGGSGAVRVMLAAAALLPPTLLMGGTLPAVVQGALAERLGRDGGFGRRVSWLYGVNTIGAVAGCLAAGFFLIQGVGMRGATWLAALVSVGVGAFVLSRTAGRRSLRAARPPSSYDTRWGTRRGRGIPMPVAPPYEPVGGFAPIATLADVVPNRPPASTRVGVALAAAAVSGFAALALEVFWTRALILTLGSSVYAFSLVLAVFLAGLAAGSAAISRWADRVGAWTGFAVLEAGVAVGCAAFLPSVENLPFRMIHAYQSSGGGFWAMTQARAGICVAVMVIPTLCLGAAFPLLARLSRRDGESVPVSLGRVYAVNTVGGALGALAAGFLLVPVLGVQASIAVAVGLYGALAVLAAWCSPTGRVIGLTAALVGAGATVWAATRPPWDPYVMSSGAYLEAAYKYARTTDEQARDKMHQGEMVFYKEGLGATVAVKRVGTTLHLRINGKVDASTGGDMGTQVLLGHLPLLLHPDPRTVLVIGLGSGVTLGAVTRHPVASVDCLEIEPAVARAARFFSEANHAALDDPRVRLTVSDGRFWLSASRKTYDVITSEPSNPWQTGVSSLFTREHYALCRSRLTPATADRPGGVMCQWVHVYGMSTEDLRMTIRTFLSVFPHAIAWDRGGDLLLIGMEGRVQVDPAQMEARLRDTAVLADLARVGIMSAEKLLSYFALGEDRLHEFAGAGPLHTDDHPRLEFSAPRNLYLNTDLNVKAILDVRESPAAAFPPATRRRWMEVAERARRFRVEVVKGSLAQLTGDPAGAREAFERARAMDESDEPVIRLLEGLYLTEAKTAYDRADYPACRAWLARVLSVNPNHAEARRNLRALTDLSGTRTKN